MTPLGLGCQLTVHISLPETIFALVMAYARSVSKPPCLGSFPRSIIGKDLGTSNKLAYGTITPAAGWLVFTTLLYE